MNGGERDTRRRGGGACRHGGWGGGGNKRRRDSYGMDTVVGMGHCERSWWSCRCCFTSLCLINPWRVLLGEGMQGSRERLLEQRAGEEICEGFEWNKGPVAAKDAGGASCG